MALSAAHAALLADQVRGRGRLARWAVRWLVWAGNRGDPRATDTVWDLWLREPSDELWEALARWRRPHTGGESSLVALGEPAAAAVVIDAARRVGHPIADAARAAILAGQQDLVDEVCASVLSTGDEEFTRFCLENHLAPADPRQAATFFLLTGQVERYRSADPDHSLLALFYSGASEGERSRIRTSIAGEPDLVRVLAGAARRDRMARLTGPEADYLVDAFAKRRDWPVLWELAKDLPVLDAAKAAHRFDGWRPEGSGATLFDTLARADLGRLAASRSAVAEPRAVRLRTAGVVIDGSFAPDGSLAVANEWSVDVFAPPFRAAARPRKRLPVLRQPTVLALNHGLVILAGTDGLGTGFLTRGGDGQRASQERTSTVVVALARTAAGFAALTSGSSGELLLRLQPEDGGAYPTPEPLFLDLSALLGIAALEGPRRRMTIATDPDSDRIAIAGSNLYLADIADGSLRLLATAPFSAGPDPRLAFSGPDRLIGMDYTRNLLMWRLERHTLRVVAERQLGKVTFGNFPVDLRAAGAVAVIDEAGVPARRRVRYLDRETLDDIPTPSWLADLYPTCLFASPDGATLAVGGHELVEVAEAGCAPAVTALADRPLAATSPADLYAVTAQLSRTPPHSAARPFLELLCGCLAYRFGMEVAIGEAAPVHARGDDIVLGGSA
jgi:hypothetical protein